jgi:hypothetical protein
MDTNLSVFTFENYDVRIVDQNGEPWFVAKDVATVLGYVDTAQAVREHCKGVVEITTPTKGGIQAVKTIPESDVYRLIMRSKKPEAEKFQDWVCGEVIPSIRKTGKYSVSPEPNESQPKLLKYWIDGYLYQFPANQQVKSVCRAGERIAKARTKGRKKYEILKEIYRENENITRSSEREKFAQKEIDCRGLTVSQSLTVIRALLIISVHILFNSRHITYSDNFSRSTYNHQCLIFRFPN